MPFVEASELLQHMRAARRYLEWGSGGSTVLAAWLSLLPDARLSELYSLESGTAFFDSLRRQYAPIRHAEATGKLKYLAAQVGPTIAWGYPQAWTARCGSNNTNCNHEHDVWRDTL